MYCQLYFDFHFMIATNLLESIFDSQLHFIDSNTNHLNSIYHFLKIHYYYWKPSPMNLYFNIYHFEFYHYLNQFQ